MWPWANPCPSPSACPAETHVAGSRSRARPCLHPASPACTAQGSPGRAASPALTRLLQSPAGDSFLLPSSKSGLAVRGTEPPDPTLTGSPSFPAPGVPGVPGAPGSPLGPAGPGLPSSPWKEKWVASGIARGQRVSVPMWTSPRGVAPRFRVAPLQRAQKDGPCGVCNGLGCAPQIPVPRSPPQYLY